MSHSSSTSRGGCCGGSSGTAIRAGNVPATSTKAGGCSCGGSCGGGCGCDCGGCQGQGQGFARPRFFAGQLLTEDDLDLLETYVVEKNRLHNRSFLGEGVACGLLVTCDPCGGGRVTVQSGYALDCCGNDIVVPCAQSLDINAYVRRLRIERTGGVDCGDPCADEKAKQMTKPATTGTSTSTGAATGASSPTSVIIRTPTPSTDTTPPPLPPAEYCLYVRYCESATDPVSPYATDDPCGAQACEATRVREGFSFELRCRNCEEEEPDNLFTRISDCIGSLVINEKSSRNLRSALMYDRQLSPALARVTRPDSAKVIVGPDRIEAASLAKIRIEALPKPENWKPENLYEAADSMQTLASLVAASQSLTAEEKRAMDPADAKALDEGANAARQTLAKFQKTMPDDEKVNALIADPVDRELTLSTIKQSSLWSAKTVTGVPSGERELLAAGIVYNPKIRSTLATSLARLKAVLVDRLGKRAVVTDCTLLRDLNAIEIPSDDQGSETSTANALVARDAMKQLGEVFLRYLRECICVAINPPCAPCDDPAVLLACLRVEGCDVRDICNLERTFVLSPVSFRYWMPFLRSFGNIIERFCCPENSCDPPKDPDQKAGGRRMSTFAELREGVPRSYMEKNSALNLADAWLGAGKQLDPAQLSVVMPARAEFSADDARRLVTSTAAVLDIAGLRRGVAPGELLGMLVRPPTVPSVPAPATPDAPAAPAAPAAPPAEVAGLHKDISEMKARLKTAEDRSKLLEAAIKKLRG